MRLAKLSRALHFAGRGESGRQTRFKSGGGATAACDGNCYRGRWHESRVAGTRAGVEILNDGEKLWDGGRSRATTYDWRRKSIPAYFVGGFIRQ